jgi:flavin reductase (DIM6/NTAB) family NADH-FMN oxidoreductase RutF
LPAVFAAPVASPYNASGWEAAPLSQGSDLRGVMRRFATGITVVTAQPEQGPPLGVTVNSLTSVSLQPPLVLICLAKYLRLHAAISEAGLFAVNLLDGDQEDVSRRFAGQRPDGDPFADLAVARGAATGAPLLAGGLGHLECRLVAAYPGGDHTIFLGEVLAAAVTDERPALVYYKSRYHRLA